MVTIAVSDVHLGYTRQKDDFKSFLDHVGNRSATRLVIVGDFLDMWRRDMAGVVIESADVLTQLERLQTQGMKIDMIAGNHDYHIRILKREGYQFEFRESGFDVHEYGKVYSYYHGYEFDDFQVEAFFEPLCYTTDDVGKQFSDFWSHLQRIASVGEWIANILMKGERRRKYEAMLASPEERLKGKFSEVRREALRVREETAKDILIYGHSHEPFVDESQTVANTGSWVKSEKYPHYNTFLEISEDSIVLKKWIEGKEEVIGERFSTNEIETMAELW